MVNLTKADQMFGKNSQMSWQTEKACEKLGTIWDWTSSGPWSNGAEMTEKYLTMDVTLLSSKKKQFFCRWRKYILWLKYFHQCIEMELTD